MNKSIKLIITLMLIVTFSCVKQSQKTEETKILFDAVDLLGKTPTEIDGILGKPYKIVSGKSSTDPETKNHWRWYHQEKDLAVFIDEDDKRFATSFTLIFNADPNDAKEAASKVGIDLNGRTPSRSNNGGSWTDEMYDRLLIKGKKVKVYYFDDSKNENTIKVSFEN